MSRLKVAISPYFTASKWKDEVTGLSFEKDERQLKVYSLPRTLNLEGIQKALRLRILFPIQEEWAKFSQGEEIVIEDKEENQKELLSKIEDGLLLI